MVDDAESVKIVEDAMRAYLYPIMVTVSAEAPLTGKDLERAWRAGYEFCALRRMTDEEMKSLINRITNDCRLMLEK